MVLDAGQFKKAKKIVAWSSTDLKRLVLRIDKDITKDLKSFGISKKIHNSGFVFHHMKYPENKGVIYSGISDKTEPRQ